MFESAVRNNIGILWCRLFHASHFNGTVHALMQAKSSITINQNINMYFQL